MVLKLVGKNMRVLVCGDRNYMDVGKVENFLLKMKNEYSDLYVITGDCSGADSFAKSVCIKHDIKYKVFKANWNEHGRAAGPIRNKEMLDHLISTDNAMDNKNLNVVAFHDDVENSKGTKNMINQSLKVLKKDQVTVISKKV
jgi:hypothetical protein